MNLVKYYVAAFLLLMVMSQPAAAADSKRPFSKSVRQGGTVFEVTSRSAVGCAAQIVTVVARRGGKKIAGLKVDVDYLAKSVQAVDLTGDGTPELAVFSRTTGGVMSDTLDVYWLDGSNLRRIKAPELGDQADYKGGDRFSLEGRQIIRTVPVYRDSDPIGKPSGGTRILRYDFREGAFALSVQPEKPEQVSAIIVEQAAAKPAENKTVAVKAAEPAGPAVTGITATDAGIEIQTNGAVKYKIIALDKPERIAIDFPGTESSLAGKKITLNRFGISTVRIGQNKGFLRVVLDTAHTKFPKYEIANSGTGVLVTFPQ